MNHAVLLWTKIHWKIPSERGFFKFWPKSKWREIEIGYLAAILKGYNILIYDFLLCINTQLYGAISIAQFRWKNGFEGSMEPPAPWAPMGVKVPWSLKC